MEMEREKSWGQRKRGKVEREKQTENKLEWNKLYIRS